MEESTGITQGYFVNFACSGAFVNTIINSLRGRNVRF